MNILLCSHDCALVLSLYSQLPKDSSLLTFICMIPLLHHSLAKRLFDTFFVLYENTQLEMYTK